MCEAVIESPVALKVCGKCLIAKPLICFSKRKRSADGLFPHCKECDLKSGKERRAKNKARKDIAIPNAKICSKCKTKKSSSEFYKNAGNKDGLNCCCKECELKAGSIRYGKNCTRKIIVIPKSKTCPKCNKEKPKTAFYKNDGREDGLDSICKECKSICARERLYKLTDEQFNALLESQGGGCAICKTKTPGGQGDWHVDHIHGTDVIRGLLHCGCNLGLGYFKDNTVLISNAIGYLLSGNLGIRYKKHWCKNGVPKALREQILASQDYKCKICSIDLRTNRLCLDHDHLTNMIRGYLCHGCNSGLGQFDDCITVMQKAINYLNKFL
jgi:hypothetical protein